MHWVVKIAAVLHKQTSKTTINFNFLINIHLQVNSLMHIIKNDFTTDWFDENKAELPSFNIRTEWILL